MRHWSPRPSTVESASDVSPEVTSRGAQPTGLDADDALDVVPLRHPGRWAAAALILVIFGLLVYSFTTNERFGWDVVGKYFLSTSVLEGLWATIWLTAISMLIAVTLGVILALMRLSANPVLRAGAGAYIWFFRGTPLLVQLIFLYNISALYPNIAFFGLTLDVNEVLTKPVVAILALALNEAAYSAEIVRAGIASVDPGQTEAAAALGMRKERVLRRIVLPQAMRVIIPPLANDTISMLKYTSLVSVIAMPELLYSAQIIYSRNFETIPLLLVASIWYLIVTTLLTLGQVAIERRFNRSIAMRQSVLAEILTSIARPRRPRRVVEGGRR